MELKIVNKEAEDTDIALGISRERSLELLKYIQDIFKDPSIQYQDENLRLIVEKCNTFKEAVFCTMSYGKMWGYNQGTGKMPPDINDYKDYKTQIKNKPF